MLVSSRGIVLKTNKYSESSIIAKVYSQKWGMLTFMVNGVRSKKATFKASLFQPLTVLDMVVYYNPAKNFQRFKEIRPSIYLQNIHFDVIKSSVAIFMAELLLKTIKEEEPNEFLFGFIEQQIALLDQCKKEASVLPLYFSLQLSKQLGFAPHNNFVPGNEVFNIKEGCFQDEDSPNGEYIMPPLSQKFFSLLESAPHNLSQHSFAQADKQVLMDKIMCYYSCHIDNFTTLNSLKVLSAVLR